MERRREAQLPAPILICQAPLPCHSIKGGSTPSVKGGTGGRNAQFDPHWTFLNAVQEFDGMFQAGGIKTRSGARMNETLRKVFKSLLFGIAAGWHLS